MYREHADTRGASRVLGDPGRTGVGDEAASAAVESDERRRLRRLAWLLDSSIRLPGGFRIGVDSVIGLVPGVGDLVGAGLSSYILLQAARMRVGSGVLGRMAGNVLLELVVGSIPLVGDLFDMAFKANQRNVALLEAHLDARSAPRSP